MFMKSPKELILLAGTKQTRKALAAQLHDIIGKFVKIRSYSVEERLPFLIENRLIILSSYLIEDEVKHVIGEGCQSIVANRTVNYEYMDQLFFIPKGTKALYVNDFTQTAADSIHTLIRLGIDHIDYYPYSPGDPLPVSTDVAITSGEVELVPPTVSLTVNIGVRLIDITTIHDILNRLHMTERLGKDVSDQYIRKMIDLSQKLAHANQTMNELNHHLKKVVDGVNDGILAINEAGDIFIFNEVLANMTGISSRYAIGKHVRHVLKQEEITAFLLNDTGANDLAFTLGDSEVLIHRFPLQKEQSIVATFKSVSDTMALEKAAKRELMKKGYVAKYAFEDIIGRSPALVKTKEIAKKLASSDLAVLIQGESGTGKELFASAMHQASERKNGPFLAVNFSALPDELLESELFGYEEGSFTGAQKGGKKGIFEQADGGTIFLDEIGDISPKLQARLLRVLQEKEIRRVGGAKNIVIDVRIIAATNRDLQHMIQAGTFRRDLYHRLKVLFLALPPLRERDGDIPLLIEALIGQQKISTDEEVLEKLSRYKWYGNVRELKNTIDYMLAVCNGKQLALTDIPNDRFFEENEEGDSFTEKREPENIEEWIVLQWIYDLHEQGVAASRKRLTRLSAANSIPLTEQQIRLRLDRLAEQGYVTKGKGRGGTRLTGEGYQLAKKMKR
jgi:transcriptional regulator with PAS, ATPase and Fis domain